MLKKGSRVPTRSTEKFPQNLESNAGKRHKAPKKKGKGVPVRSTDTVPQNLEKDPGRRFKP
jgi:hypothetical protein